MEFVDKIMRFLSLILFKQEGDSSTKHIQDLVKKQQSNRSRSRKGGRGSGGGGGGRSRQSQVWF